MMTRRRFSALAVALALLAAPGAPVLAQDGLAAAKAAGQVGERPDGLLGLVQAQAPADVRSLVSRVNEERRKQYEQVARSTGRSLPEVQAVAGQRLIGATPAGQYVMEGGGRWVKR
jgi:hypothetical protein